MDLSERVEQLERRNKRTTIVLAGCLLLVVVGMGARQKQRAAPSDTLDTKMLRLFDDQGKVRGFITVSPKGNATITLADHQGQVCAVFGVTNDAKPSLELSHSDKSLRARLSLDPAGLPALEFYDADGKVTHHMP